MTHRAKHRHQALLIRAGTGRTIKTDLNPDGTVSPVYLAAKELVAKTHGNLADVIRRRSSLHQASLVKKFIAQEKPDVPKTPERRLLPVQGFLRNMW